MTESLTTTNALAPPSPIAEWHAHLDLQVRAGQMAKDKELKQWQLHHVGKFMTAKANIKHRQKMLDWRQ